MDDKDDGCSDLLKAIEKVYDAHIIYKLATGQQFSFHAERASMNKLEEVNKLIPQIEAELQEPSLKYVTLISCLRKIRSELEQLNYPFKPTLESLINSKADVEPICELLLLDSAGKDVSIDLDGLLSSIVDCMSIMCSQARDVNIVQLRTVTSIAKMIGGILVTLKEMAIDLANYMITAVQGTCRDNWKPWVRQKFNEIVTLSARHDIDILSETRQWLTDTYEKDCHQSRTKDDLIERAFANLLTSDRTPAFPFTLEFEAKTLNEVKVHLYQKVLVKCIRMMTNDLNLHKWPQNIEEHVDVLVKEYPNESIDNVLQSIIVEIKHYYNNFGCSQSITDKLSNCIAKLSSLDKHPLFSVYLKRLKKTLIEMLKCKTTAEAEIILKQADHDESFKNDLFQFYVGSAINYFVFSDIYLDIVEHL